MLSHNIKGEITSVNYLTLHHLNNLTLIENDYTITTPLYMCIFIVSVKSLQSIKQLDRFIIMDFKLEVLQCYPCFDNS